MSAGEISDRSFVTAGPDEPVSDAAKRVARDHALTLVVTDEGCRPVGILTARDLRARCVGKGLDPESTPVASVMTPVQAVRETASIDAALQTLGDAGARRLAVTDECGRLVGVLDLDAVLELLTREAETIERLMSGAMDEPPRP